MPRQVAAILAAMHKASLRRLIFISSMGIYNEDGERHDAVLEPYRRSAAAVEASDLNYTVIRPAWLNDNDEIAYGTTVKGEPFGNPSVYVSRKSVADLIVKLVTEPGFCIQESIGVHGL